MSSSNKSQNRKRLLLDEEELKPKTDAWDFFYGKVSSAGANLSEVTSLPSQPHVGQPSIPVAPIAKDRHESTLTEISSRTKSDAPLQNDQEFASKYGDAPRSTPELISTLQVRESSERNPPASQSNKAKRTKEISPALNGTTDTTNSKGAQDLGEQTYEDFERAFKKRLTKADLKVCKIVFNLTYAIGAAKCIIRVGDLVEQVGISRRHLFRVLSELENSGFIARGGIYNTPTKRGIELTFYPTPHVKKQGAIRQFHYYDE